MSAHADDCKRDGCVLVGECVTNAVQAALEREYRHTDDCLRAELAAMRAELEIARSRLLSIAGIVNGYFNDGCRDPGFIGSLEALRRVRDALGVPW